MSLKNLVYTLSPKCFEIDAQTHARLPYSFLTQIFLQLGILEKKYTKLGFRTIVKIVSRSCFVGTHVGPEAHHSSFNDD